MSAPWWPLVDLRLTGPDVDLRAATEADLPTILEILPDDLERNPDGAEFGVDPHTQRLVTMAQAYWAARGNWRAESWNLIFAVRHGGSVVGLQALEGDDFAALRTVDSWSFLSSAVRGRGFGKQMRRAILALAFGPMEAQAAISSAWHDNHASLGVSRSLGYRDNGVTTNRRGDGHDTMVHLRMTRDDWLRAAHGDDINIVGFEACRPFLGI